MPSFKSAIFFLKYIHEERGKKTHLEETKENRKTFQGPHPWKDREHAIRKIRIDNIS